VSETPRIQLPSAPPHLAAELAAGGSVAWSQPITVHTYEVGDPDPYPLFVDRRVYQGSSGRVYPIPFIDRVDTEGAPRQWQAIHLENRWIRLVVLPELGGRIHIGYDKTAEYDFFYRNNVIKPALVGLAGPWVSGGVEFNWPQHHRPATYLPVSTHIEQAPDGTVTVWCSDHDPFARMKGMHGIRLHPDRAAVELVVKLHNRTSESQTFLWWANVAARVHDNYQSFFPSDVHFVADHARRAITAFPHADRPYYGVDYPAMAKDGGDRLDWYKNIPVPTSYMVTATKEDFFGGYDHDAEAGFVHVADRHIAPGKKQWTWGNSPFGHAWDRLLTDGDGPYVELMAGVYTDNQPDFAWLEPGETKQFTQTWFPIQRIGPVDYASPEGAISIKLLSTDRVAIGVAVTFARPGSRIEIIASDEEILGVESDLVPGDAWTWTGSLPAGTEAADLEVRVTQGADIVLQRRPRVEAPATEPRTASAPPLPGDIQSNDELFWTGMHLHQYRHPTRSPLPYWEEAIRRDPGDARCRVALADVAYRRGEYLVAETHLRVGLERATALNGNPRDGEASYLLGMVLARTGRHDEAVDALAKAAWDGRWAAPAGVEIARLALQRGDRSVAIEKIDQVLASNPADARAVVIRAITLRKSGRTDDATRLVDLLLAADPLDHVARVLRDGEEAAGSLDGRTIMDVATDLSAAGETELALRLLEIAGRADVTPAGEVRPIAHYRRAQLLELLGDSHGAAAAREAAHLVPDALCFPAGLDDHDALQAALRADPDDERAQDLLAMLLFDRGRQAEALKLWREVIARPTASTRALRNAALAVYAVEGDLDAASGLYNRAIEAKPDGRLLFERDQLLERMAVSAEDRLSLLEPHRDIAFSRDDLTVEYADLLVDVGRWEEALQVLQTRPFAPWEGGEGKVLGVWERIGLVRAEEAERSGDLTGALNAIATAVAVPPNIGEDRHPLADTTTLFGRWADFLERTGDLQQADEVRKRIRASTEVRPIGEDGTIDYFATSLPDLLLFPPK